MLRSLLVSHTRRQLERKRSVLAIFGAVLGGVAGLLITGGLAMVAQASERARTAAAGLLFVGLGLLALAGAVVMTIIAHRLRITPGYCVECGYELRGVRGPCPECNTAVAKAAGPQAGPTAPALGVRGWLLIAACIVAAAPIYGYFARPGPNAAAITWLMAACWLATLATALPLTLRAILRPGPITPSGHLPAAIARPYLIAACVIGWGGTLFAWRAMSAAVTPAPSAHARRMPPTGQ